MVVGEHLKFERKDVWDMKWADVSTLTDAGENQCLYAILSHIHYSL